MNAASENRTSPSVEPNDPATRADEGIRRATQGAHDTIDRVAEMAAPHVRAFERQVDEVGQAFNDHGEEWIGQARQAVRDHPIAAVASALAVGLLIARIAR